MLDRSITPQRGKVWDEDLVVGSGDNDCVRQFYVPMNNSVLMPVSDGINEGLKYRFGFFPRKSTLPMDIIFFKVSPAA